MILIVLAGLCVLTVPLTGGSLRRLGDLRIRALWLGPIALGLQLTVTTVVPGGSHWLHAAIHISTYLMIGVFLWANRHLPGALLIATGAGMNFVVILLNGGVMPAAAGAQRIAGLTVPTGFNNSAHLAHPLAPWLGDVIPVPGPLPNVMSVGDLVIYAGLLVLLHRACAEPRPRVQRDPGVQI